MRFLWGWPVLPVGIVRVAAGPIVLKLGEIYAAHQCLLELLCGLSRPSDRPAAPSGREAFSALFERLRENPRPIRLTREAIAADPTRLTVDAEDRPLIAYAIEVVLHELSWRGELHARAGASATELQGLNGKLLG